MWPWNGAARAGVLAIIGLSVVIRLALIVTIRPFAEDDLITLRYSDNIGLGHGWVFNPGEHVLGSTSPAWTLIGVPFVRLLSADQMMLLVSLLCLAFFATAMGLTVVLARKWRLGLPAVYGLLAILAVHETLVINSINGMEAPLFTLLVLAVVLLRDSDRPGWQAFALAGVATLVRPEGGILIVALALSCLPHWRRAVVGVLASVAVVTPWVVFATAYFGSPVPQSASAKSGLLSTGGGPILSFGETWILATRFFGTRLAAGPAEIVVTIAVLVLIVIAVLELRSTPNPSMAVLAWFLVGYLAFWYIGQGEIFEWYTYPSAWVALLLATAGFDRIWRFGRALGRANARRPMVSAATLSLVAVVAMFAVKFAAGIPDQRDEQQINDLQHRAAGEWLARCGPSRARVLLEPIGYIGFFSGLPILDVQGLVSPEFAGLKLNGVSGWPGVKIEEEQPEIVVLRRYEVPRNEFFAAHNDPMFGSRSDRTNFEQTYRQVRSFGQGDRALIVYAREGTRINCS